jgi:hypothetical protein
LPIEALQAPRLAYYVRDVTFLRLLFWLVVGVALLVLWLVLGTRRLCPSCGLELGRASFSDRVDAFVGERRLDRCGRCGWTKGAT